MEYNVYLNPSVEKQLNKIPLKIRDRIIKQILSLKNNPRPIGVKKLTDEDGYRIRIGNYRVLYVINDKIQSVEIYRVAPRKDVYR